ncbi:hypothetical protein [Streptomyces aquilus]|uniref:hypothetical protein n=1 Tax=Streptomyces aquilus TaxID=2548456 RepID=UPI0014052C53|nr:hypothetical protein [Streptomyces aquilus]
MDDAGQALAWNGADWTPPQMITPKHDLTGISCGTVDFCAAVGSEGDEFFATR